MCINQKYISKKWLEARLAMREKFLDEKVPQSEKFCSFLKSSLLPRNIRCNFPFLLNNDRWSHLKFKPKIDNYITRANYKTVYIIYNFYLLVYMALYCYYSDMLSRKELVYKNRPSYFLKKFFNLNIFNKFFKNFIYIKNFNNQDILLGYYMDKNYLEYYININNLYKFYYLKIFYVISNFEYFKNEDLAINKNKEVLSKLKLINKESLNLTYLGFNSINLVNYQSKIFFSYCIYELYIYMYIYFFNYISADFFHKSSIIIKLQKLKYINYYLTNFCYSYSDVINNTLNNNFIKEKKSRKFIGYNKLKSEYEVQKNFFIHTRIKKVYHHKIVVDIYNKYNIKYYYKLYEKNKLNKYFNYSKSILDIKNFNIRIPYAFFHIFIWYCIYYRRFKYNIYIENHLYFNEYVSHMHYFILINSPSSTNKGKHKTLRFEKFFIKYYFSVYLTYRQLCVWFNIYKATELLLSHYSIKSYNIDFYNILSLLKDFDIQLIYKLKRKWHILERSVKTEVFDIRDKFILTDSYHLLMQAIITKYDVLKQPKVYDLAPNFRVVREGASNLQDLSVVAYSLHKEVKEYNKFLKYKLKKNLVLNFYNKNLVKFFFNFDLFNYNNKSQLLQLNNILVFYLKLINLILIAIAPYRYKLIFNKIFPRKNKKKIGIWRWSFRFLIFRSVIKFEFKNCKKIIFNKNFYDYFILYLKRRMDTNSYKFREHFLCEYYTTSINYLYNSRFKNLLKIFLFFLKKKRLKYSYPYMDNFNLLKEYYYDIISSNIDLYLLLFLLNKNIISNIVQIKIYNPIELFILNNFIYRYYIYLIVFLENFYYNDWYYNKNKNIFWIYKNFEDQEGLLFYTNSKTII